MRLLENSRSQRINSKTRAVILIALILILSSYESTAQNFRSQELNAPLSQSAHSQKSIASLENEISQLQDAYAKSSTAKYLARHFSYGDHKDYAKAVQYYRLALNADGLADAAKQELTAELASIYFLQKNFPQYLNSFNQFIALGGNADQELNMMRAIAYYHNDQKSEAMALADQLFNSLVASAKQQTTTINTQQLPQLKQLLYLYFNEKNYQRAAQVQEHIITLDNRDFTQWQRLHTIYMKQGDPQKSAEALLLAHQYHLPLSETELLLLCDLQASSNNPYLASRLLEEFLAQQTVKASKDNYRRLFSYWYQAEDLPKAIAAFEKSVALSSNPEDLLDLSELYLQSQQWQKLQNQIVTACNNGLGDGHMGRANLLLGMSELKLGNEASARRAFINATLLSGRREEANDYLTFMRAPPANEDELSEFYGPCKPSWSLGGTNQLKLNSISGINNLDASNENMQLISSPEMLDFNVEVSAPIVLVAGSYQLKQQDFARRLKPLAVRLGSSIIQNKAQITGPMYFLFSQNAAKESDQIKFQMAFPVNEKPKNLGRYEFIQDSGYYHASHVFKGKPEEILERWQQLHLAAIARGHKPSGSSRQIIINPTKASAKYIELELQLGLLATE